jgi:hypothetical protein
MRKLAICFYSLDDKGSFGTDCFQEKKRRIKICYQYMKRNFISLYDVDIFFHGWVDPLSKYAVKLISPKKFKLNKKIKKKNLLNNYSIKYIDFYDDIADLKIRKIDPIKDYNNFINKIQNRFFSQTESLNILLKDSRFKLNKYDHIVSCRYDLIFKKEIRLTKPKSKKIFTVLNRHIPKNQTNDIFLYGFKNILKIKKYFKNIHKYPVGPKRGLSVFFKKENIKTNDLFKSKEIIPADIYFNYIDINILKKFLRKFIVTQIYFLNFVQKKIRKTIFMMYSLIR